MTQSLHKLTGANKPEAVMMLSPARPWAVSPTRPRWWPGPAMLADRPPAPKHWLSAPAHRPRDPAQSLCLRSGVPCGTEWCPMFTQLTVGGSWPWVSSEGARVQQVTAQGAGLPPLMRTAMLSPAPPITVRTPGRCCPAAHRASLSDSASSLWVRRVQVHLVEKR